MIGAVIVTHGRLARELLEATERIVGPTEGIKAVTIDWDGPWMLCSQNAIPSSLIWRCTFRGSLMCHCKRCITTPRICCSAVLTRTPRHARESWTVTERKNAFAVTTNWRRLTLPKGEPPMMPPTAR